MMKEDEARGICIITGMREMRNIQLYSGIVKARDQLIPERIWQDNIKICPEETQCRAVK
jgi:hypothetical protein